MKYLYISKNLLIFFFISPSFYLPCSLQFTHIYSVVFVKHITDIDNK